MAKKDDSFWDTIKEMVQVIASVGFNTLWGSVKSSAMEVLDEAQHRAEIVVSNLIKSLTIFGILTFGLILGVVGLGKFLSESIRALNHGLGYVVLGLVLVVVALIMQSTRKPGK